MSKIHITLEIDIPFEHLPSFLRLIRQFDDSRNGCTFGAIYKRGAVPIAELQKLQTEIFPESGPVKILMTKEEVDFVKDVLRGTIESEGNS